MASGSRSPVAVWFRVALATAFATGVCLHARAAMVVEYRMDEGQGNTLTDTSGSATQYDGTITGATWQASDNPHNGGGFGHYLRFDGNDRVEAAQPGGELGFPNNSPFTVEFWFRLPASVISENHEILGVRYVNQLAGWGIGYMGAGGAAGSSPGDWALFLYGVKDLTFSGLTTLADTWQHFALVHDPAAGTYTAYLTPANGTTSSVTISETASPASSLGALQLGGDTAVAADYVGDLDQVRLHTSALSPGEFGLDAVAVPEPRFHGVLLLGALALAFARRTR